jgi:uncharacterized SAM-binding protein YcdF (DUF218 family)
MNYLEVSWIIFNVVTGIVLWFVALFLLACGLMAILEREYGISTLQLLVGTAIFVTGMVMLTYASSLGVS